MYSDNIVTFGTEEYSAINVRALYIGQLLNLRVCPSIMTIW